MINRFTILIVSLNIIFGSVPDASGVNGAVTSSNKFASDVGINILKDGGNAVDAAIAVGFALAVVHPGAGNIGGGGFMVIRLADGTKTTIDFRETAPQKASRDMFLDENGDIIEGKSWSTSWASGVPGSVAGFGLAHEEFGTLKWSQLIDSSIQLARDGYSLNYNDANSFNRYNDFLTKDSVTRTIFVRDEEFKTGDILVQRNLASTLERISRAGWEEFYTGKTADLIQKCMERTDGLISKNDLKNYIAVQRDPITFSYRDHIVYSMPPASSGGIALAGILNQLENIDLSSLPFHGADHIHYLTECQRRVYADRSTMLGDMDFIPVPISHLISQEYADNHWMSIDSIYATSSSEILPEEPPSYYESEETTHYSVVDKWGNAVSVTTTINGWFGSGITVDGAGFLLNNEMDDFSSKPGTPNAYGLVGAKANEIASGKRMLSSMTPTIVENPNGDLLLVVGSPGGSTIITTAMQVISNVIDFKMNIEDAVESPRYHHQWLPDVVYVEQFGYATETLDALKERGYKFALRSSIGEANCIMYDPNTKIIHASGDSRRGASAIAY
ncbi:MAG: gamma-glutamyltransferase [Candidatus Marinimicrobia bacterium]|nr:gamma-glutamyltransferase [Candidatus Neomarinimicrobiota bacterium]MBT3634478.1 gamma-glutamyltransferase [Candidatus Neomarinimicrobiota bacterium]MBT3683304.1 gamma-glutamyltransferase [Candidatus Neomarinimicrobiota bacterium]MBT3760193.1 gamma-glutamyltransferase [Candidatus Neomarinimicrobiota bacterium]MBT3896288.1 gamma-glutamyltransferase [Candidatus Neomarinimicrobiota bacterium]